jgi:hypothetical protein
MPASRREEVIFVSYVLELQGLSSLDDGCNCFSILSSHFEN